MGAKLTRTHSSSIDERFLKPVGKYSIKSSDLKKLKKKILDEKLAPFYPGVDTDDDESAGFDPAATCFAEVEEERKVQEARMRWLAEERKRDQEIERRRSS